MARFQFSSPDGQTTDGQNRLLNPASRMRARGKYIWREGEHLVAMTSCKRDDGFWLLQG